MWAYNRMKLSVSSMSSTKWRRVCVAFLVVFIFFGYIAPWLIQQNKTSQMTTDCMTLKVEEIRKYISPTDAVILYPGKEEPDPKILPYIGNGNLGFVINHLSPHNLRLKYEVSKTVMAPYRPMLRVSVQKYSDKTLYVVNYKKGKVERIQCYFVMNTCVWLNVTSFIHRTRPSVFYEVVTLENKSPVAVILEVSRNGPFYWKGSGTSTESFRINGKEHHYSLSSGRFPAPYPNDKAHQHHIALVVAATSFSKLTEVPPESIHQTKTQSIIKYSEPFLDAQSETNILSNLVDKVEEELFSFLGMDMTEIEQEHINIWSENIWNSFLTVEPVESVADDSEEEDKHVLNMELAFATSYYLLSSVPAYFVLPSTTKHKKREMLQELQRPTSCFNGQPTLHDSALWRGLLKESELNDLLSHWMHVLYKQGCAGLLSAGTQGVNQAVMLSFLGGQFADKELSFHADPSKFEGRYYFHNVIYNTSFIDIYVDPRLSKQTVQVRLANSHTTQSSKPMKLYMCEAGCPSEPKELHSEYQTLELRWTDPSSPFLYISHSKEHLINLRRIIHINKSKRLDEIPPKVESGKSEPFHIPMFFWIAIVSMIILFHMFLIKLIYNEYCSDRPASNRIISWKGGKDGNQA